MYFADGFPTALHFLSKFLFTMIIERGIKTSFGVPFYSGVLGAYPLLLPPSFDTGLLLTEFHCIYQTLYDTLNSQMTH